jgi:anhydro-N-acetylmuramic acid kinase
MDFITDHFKSIKVITSLEKGINPDAKEALLFAILANETISGNQDTFANTNNNMPNVSMGKICLPD